MTTYKTPDAILPRTWDFTNDLPSGETIQTGVVKIYDCEGNDVSATMLGSSSKTDTTVSAVIKAGEDLFDYTIEFTATTQHYKFVETLFLKVRKGF
jgi:hypothetical protein